MCELPRHRVELILLISCCEYLDWGDPKQALDNARPSLFVTYLE